MGEALRSQFTEEDELGLDTLEDAIVDNIEDYAYSIPTNLYDAVLDPIVFRREE